MTHRGKSLASASADQITKNIELTGQFLHEVIADPTILDEIPDGATVVVMPADDPDLATRNLGLAVRMAEQGETVVLQRVGVPLPQVPTWQETERRSLLLRPTKPRWPTEPPLPNQADWIITYDGGHDELVIDMYARRRSGVALPKNELLGILVDKETHEAMGYVIYRFLEIAAQKAPHLIGLLTNAELVDVNDERIAQLQAGPIPSADQTAPSLVDELGQLSA